MKAERRILSKRCMIQYIPSDIFRASFKFCHSVWGRIKGENGGGGKRNETPIQIVFIKKLKIVSPLSKMKPCTRRGPKIGIKKTLLKTLLTIK